jgi:hypothetical protein
VARSVFDKAAIDDHEEPRRERRENAVGEKDA